MKINNFVYSSVAVIRVEKNRNCLFLSSQTLKAKANPPAPKSFGPLSTFARLAIISCVSQEIIAKPSCTALPAHYFIPHISEFVV